MLLYISLHYYYIILHYFIILHCFIVHYMLTYYILMFVSALTSENFPFRQRSVLLQMWSLAVVSFYYHTVKNNLTVAVHLTLH